MLKAHFDQLAAYNRWANRRIYADAASLPDELRKRPAGLFFGSVHATLNHLLVADYIWMRRFTGEGPQPERLNQILHEDFSELRSACVTRSTSPLYSMATLPKNDMSSDPASRARSCMGVR